MLTVTPEQEHAILAVMSGVPVHENTATGQVAFDLLATLYRRAMTRLWLGEILDEVTT